MSTLRLFFAIETPPEIKLQITAIRERLPTSNADVKWEPTEKLHTTLKFLGDVQTDLLPEIVSYLEGLCRQCPPFNVKYTGIGCFPDRQTPKVVWVGLEDTKNNLGDLQSSIENGMANLGLQREEHQFHPHVTLGRVKSNKNINSLLTIMESATFESQPVTISEVVLFKSELHPNGSSYSVLHRFSLHA